MFMQGIVLALVTAVTVEALVEYCRTAAKTARGGGWLSALLQGSAVVLSVGICLLCGADIYGALGITFAWLPAGSVLTGIFAARGANFVSDFAGQLRNVLGK